MTVNTLPDGFRITPILATKDGNRLYAFLEQVFDAKLLDRQDTPGGEPVYMTVCIGDSVVSVMRPLEGGRPTRSAFYIYVPDVDFVHRLAVRAGARSVQEPSDAVHGDRMATIIDPFGNQWTVASRIEQISVEELHRRLADS
ncbi:MAG: VOC family protein [Acidobacteriaceae bacterium]|nr:VOC family protein [Acidobacteriaceae bacterium]